MINNSPSTILEPLLQNQLLQEALTQRQCENRQSCILSASTNQREKSDSASSVQKSNQQQLPRKQKEKTENTKGKNRASSLSDRQRHARNSSLNDKRRGLRSSFSSTDSECDVVSVSSSTAKMVPKNKNLMASLPTITLQRAFEPEELLTDSYNTSRHKLLPEEEILFLPKELPITISHTSKARETTADQHVYFRSGRENSSYQNISKHKTNSSNNKSADCGRRPSVDHVPRKNYKHPLYDRKRPTVLNNEGNVCYSNENDVLSQRNPWFGEEDSCKPKSTHFNSMGNSKNDYYSSCPSFKSLQSSNSNYHRRKLNRT